MEDRYRQFKTAISEEACLSTLMELRFGERGIKCPACCQYHSFSPAVKRRAAECTGCGYALYPAVGTPFEKLRTSLTDWFFAISLMGESGRVSKELERQARLSPSVAQRIEHELAAFLPLTKPGKPFAGWPDAIRAMIEAKAGKALSSHTIVPQPAPAPGAAIVSPHSRRSDSLGSGLLVVAAGLVGAGLSIATVLLVLQRGPESYVSEALAPILSPIRPRPTLTLASVEEDLAVVKAAIEEVAGVPAPPTLSSPRPPPSVPAIGSSGDPNEIIRFGPVKVRRHVMETVIRASRVVGADPTLLMAVADKESSFSTEVKAKTSSATGLFQFIESTWLGVINEFGSAHGLSKEADAIVRKGNQYTVPDPAERRRILDLRRDPYLSALLAGEMLKRDTLRIEKLLGRHLTGGEIYLIHFLGPDAAKNFISRLEDDPASIAANHFERAAKANVSIFFDKEGGRSLSEVHKQFEEMITTRLDRYSRVRHLAAGNTAL